LHVPFGYLFLAEPPEEDLPIPDRRTLPEARYGGLTAGFRDFLADLTFNRDWYRERLIEVGAAPLPFVGRFGLNAPVTDVARDIRLTLGLDGVELPSGADAVLGAPSDLAEAAGIWVVRTGVVAANPYRPLSLTDFRGLAMADPIAPLIAINSVDFPSARSSPGRTRSPTSGSAPTASPIPIRAPGPRMGSKPGAMRSRPRCWCRGSASWRSGVTMSGWSRTWTGSGPNSG
jgi:hypothetical protein